MPKMPKVPKVKNRTCNPNFDGFVKSQKTFFFVIPAKAGIQSAGDGSKSYD
jgi:hypothetical protein